MHSCREFTSKGFESKKERKSAIGVAIKQWVWGGVQSTSPEDIARGGSEDPLAKEDRENRRMGQRGGRGMRTNQKQNTLGGKPTEPVEQGCGVHQKKRRKGSHGRR